MYFAGRMSISAGIENTIFLCLEWSGRELDNNNNVDAVECMPPNWHTVGNVRCIKYKENLRWIHFEGENKETSTK